ncbi:two-component sensor histidine kinase [Microlunatus endophyticus]|uniref:histidine kinase n=1 Tax=Microlunatus endophyticus TaxID=1716077 RepID=A0A917W496_9ACTN|nr:HAMP domain-containing sensor histidine kinase [Microlunatus endophyticus]GGL61883.1 two-component sensor histidine kinase [Microlunatus endophyticus]
MSQMLHDRLIITGITVLTCLVVAGVAWALLRLVRKASIRYQVIIAVFAPVLAVAGTVVINVRYMFLSAHDSGVIILALIVSLVLAAALGLLVARRIVVGATHVGAGITDLAPGTPRRPAAAGDTALPAELAGVMAELDSTRIRLAEARERAQAAQYARQQLVRHLSHDLRTPLSGLRAMAEALEDGMVTDVGLAMRQIRATVGRMDSLVGDLFELSRVQGGPPDREHKLLSVRELIIDLVDEVETVAERESVTLRVDVPQDDRLAISGDADDLVRALGNLVTNAVRHTGPGGMVAITAGRGPGGDVGVAVADGCGGIPEPDLSRVFDAGWRGDQSRTGADGAGLGLAIARGVVESHQGRIAVRNTDDGCRFDVELPASGRSAG